MEEYIKRVLEGDSSAYEPIIQKYQNMIFCYVNKMVQDVHGAEEITQDVFIRGYYQLGKYDDSYSLKTWYYKIAKNLTLNFIKKKKREQSLIEKVKAFQSKDSEIVLGHDISEDMFSQAIEEAMSKLTIQDKNLLLLKSVEELTYSELAHIYEAKESTIRKRYERVKKKFIIAYDEGSNKKLCQN